MHPHFRKNRIKTRGTLSEGIHAFFYEYLDKTSLKGHWSENYFEQTL